MFQLLLGLCVNCLCNFRPVTRYLGNSTSYEHSNYMGDEHRNIIVVY